MTRGRPAAVKITMGCLAFNGWFPFVDSSKPRGASCAIVVKKTGSQTVLFGVTLKPIELIAVNGTLMISKRGAQRVLSQGRGVTDRAARADVSSAYGQGWTEPRGRINDPFARVNSFKTWARALDASRPSSIENGKKRQPIDGD